MAVAVQDLAEAQVVWVLDSWRSFKCRFHTVLVRIAVAPEHMVH